MRRKPAAVSRNYQSPRPLTATPFAPAALWSLSVAKSTVDAVGQGNKGMKEAELAGAVAKPLRCRCHRSLDHEQCCALRETLTAATARAAVEASCQKR